MEIYSDPITLEERRKIVLAVSKKILKLASMIVWISGAIVLLLKAATLFIQAVALQSAGTWSWLVVAVAVLIGGLKARYLFSRFCRKNLDRIASLHEPRLWQAFRPGFYIFLSAMVLLGTTLSTLAAGSYPALMALTALDTSIGIALLGSVSVFFDRK